MLSFFSSCHQQSVAVNGSQQLLVAVSTCHLLSVDVSSYNVEPQQTISYFSSSRVECNTWKHGSATAVGRGGGRRGRGDSSPLVLGGVGSGEEWTQPRNLREQEANTKSVKVNTDIKLLPVTFPCCVATERHYNRTKAGKDTLQDVIEGT